MVDVENYNGGGCVGVGEGVGVGEAGAVWLCRGWGWCIEEAAVSRGELFHSLRWK
jgi:hypothetical protein